MKSRRANNMDQFSIMEEIADLCEQAHLSPTITCDEDGFFTIEFGDGQKGFFSSSKQAISFIKRTYLN
jgi:hypothetical protein